MSTKRGRLLTDEEFHSYHQSPMTNVTEAVVAESEELLDIWDYVQSIDKSDLGDLYPHDVSRVWRHPTGRWEHVQIDTCAENVHLVIVIDLEAKTIVGHHVLNLNEKYGLSN